MRCGTMESPREAIAVNCRMWGQAGFSQATPWWYHGPAPYRRQNAGVSKAMKLRISSRPSSMARVHTQIWKSVSTA